MVKAWVKPMDRQGLHCVFYKVLSLVLHVNGILWSVGHSLGAGGLGGHAVLVPRLSE